jgi:hypothetical protein
VAKETAAIIVDLRKYTKYRLPDVGEIDDVAKYTLEMPKEDLLVANIAIGEAFKNFKDWFWQHLEFVRTLRESLPKRGLNRMSITKADGTTKEYKWSEFCLEFWGVSDSLVRKYLAQADHMHDEPEFKLGENDPDYVAQPNSEQGETGEDGYDKDDEVGKLEQVELRARAQLNEFKATKLVMEIEALIDLLESEERLSVKANDYIRGLKQRLKHIGCEQEHVGSNLSCNNDELDAVKQSQPEATAA